MKRRLFARAPFVLFALIFFMGGCGSNHTSPKTVTFPASDEGKSEFNASIYEIEPFTLSLELPDGWTIQAQEKDENFELLPVFSKLSIFNQKGDCVGAVGYNTYEIYEDAGGDPMAIYHQIALGNDYRFDVKNTYRAVRETGTETAAVVDVRYSASINNGAEKVNKGIVCHHEGFLVYIAAELDSDSVTDDLALAIAGSARISRG